MTRGERILGLVNLAFFVGLMCFGIPDYDARHRIANLEARLAALEKAAISNASLIIKQDAQGNQIWYWSPPTNSPSQPVP